MKKRLLLLLLALVFLLGALSGGVLAGDNYTTGETNGLSGFTLSCTPTATPYKATEIQDPLKVVLPNGQQMNYPYLTEYIIQVPEGTTSVQIDYQMTDINSQTDNRAFFMTAEESITMQSQFMYYTVPSEGKVTGWEVKLDEKGEGQTPFILPYTCAGSGAGLRFALFDATANIANRAFRFRVVAEKSIASFEQNLPAHTEYVLGQTAQALSVTVSAPENSQINYVWYRGATADSMQVISGETTSSITPDTSKLGVTFYQVKATVTPPEGTSAEIYSEIAKVVVKDENVQFSLKTYNIYKDQPLIAASENNQTVYTCSVEGSTNKILGTIKGTLPDDVTITQVWTGSPADSFDLEKSGALKLDYDTNTFELNLRQAARVEDCFHYDRPLDIQSHSLGRCLYLKTKDNKTGSETVYTIFFDSSKRTGEAMMPELVQLLSGEDVLTDFLVDDLTNTRSSALVRGTLTADNVILRAQVYGGGIDLIEEDTKDASQLAPYWKEAVQNWVYVNGTRVGGNFYSAKAGSDSTSPAFTLKPGLNVVEVYTNISPFFLNNNRKSTDAGLTDTYVYTGNANQYNYTYTPKTLTNSVVYLIDYQGESATSVPQEKTDTTLSEITALRFGGSYDKVALCPVTKDGDTYQLTLPETYHTNDTSSGIFGEFIHTVLIAAEPKAAGASAVFSGAEGLVLGKSAANCAFLNAEALYGSDDPSFTITVTSGSETKDYTVKVKYASSETKPTIDIQGPTLDVPYNDSTYAYYLNYKNASSASGTMTVTIPAGATATVNGKSITSGEKITLDPKEDFYRVTITAADGLNTSNYYFVTRYENGTIPYATISKESKALAQEMLGGWYDALKGSKYFASYWNVFMAKATGNADGSEYDFDGMYVKDPARHGMRQTTDWAACILEIVMMGRNPYSFPRYVNGELDVDFDYVNDGLLATPVGAWGNPVWYHMAARAAGAAPTVSGMQAIGLMTKFNLDIRAWAIASLSGCLDAKNLLIYVDALHDVQDTSGTYTSLWTDQSWHGSSGGNTYTTGCVLSAIAASGADPDKLFAYGNNTPLQTIYNTMYKDGLFFSRGSKPEEGTLPKDMVIGLGDILHGSNVWARYTLTADKYDALIVKANALSVDTSSMPATFTQTTACGKAYYDLYDAVYAALVAAGRTAEAKEMRPDVIWGMPYEAFADEVNKMPEASALTAENLADLEKLIAQYEAMDDSNRKAVASDVLSRYQALVKRGLALKAEGTSADTARISKIYDEILALPAASEITESNVEATLAKVTEIEQEIGTLSEEEKSLLTWMDSSLLQKLEDIKKAAPKQDITVSFTLYGDTLHKITTDDDVHTYFFDGTSLNTWIETMNVTVPEGSTVLTVFEKVLDEKKFDYINKENLSYISSITTDKGLTLAEKNNTEYSGWMYLVNGTYADVGLNAKEVKSGDKIVWHFTDDYRLEHSGMAYTPERVIEYVANLYDVSTSEKANAAYSKISTEYKTQVDALRANRKSVRDVTALIEAITDWNVPMKTANDRTAVTQWVRDKLNKELADKLDGVALDVGIDYYHGVTPATDEADGKYTVEITVSKGSGSLGATGKLEKAGVITKAPSANAGVLSVTVCGTSASASEDGSTYTVTVPYGSTVTADSFTITLSSNAASITADPAETESGVWTFTVTAEDGTTTAEYTVQVSVASKPASSGSAGKPSKSNKDPQTAEPDDGRTFTDVRTGSWYYEAVQYAAENGLMTGTSANEFSPNANTTRSMIVTILARMEGVDTSGGATWYAAGRTWAMNAGISDGTNMDGKITREQLAAMLYRYAKLKGYDVSASADISAYTDASSVSSWAADAMRWAVGAGLINGRTATTLAPQGNATRAEVAAILMRFAQKIVK